MKIKFFLLCALFLCMPFMAYAENAVRHPEGTVVYCFDGDTLKLNDRRIVRLAGIDAPEKAHEDQPAQYYSRQARQLLESLARGKQVRLEFPGTETKDRYGRLIADVILPDGQSLNDLMVSQGAASFYPHQNLGPQFQERLRELQANAILERRGMWEYILELPLANENYIGNRASLRFFPENCPTSQRIKPRNRENFGTLMDAYLAGYAPARICPFWPEDK